MSIEIHPTAMVDGNAQLGEGVKVGPYATLGVNQLPNSQPTL